MVQEDITYVGCITSMIVLYKSDISYNARFMKKIVFMQTARFMMYEFTNPLVHYNAFFLPFAKSNKMGAFGVGVYPLSHASTVCVWGGVF